MSAVLGLDIGGANLKAAHTDGTARSVPFALWRNPHGLADALRHLVGAMPRADRLAVTMTGELCDCFENRRQGVGAILDAVEAMASGRLVRVWRTDGRFTTTEEARTAPLLTASANWLALATFAGRLAPSGPALLIDVGSTTTDVIPLLDGVPVPRGRTDAERMESDEVVYKGVGRTPVCALMDGSGAAEFFATTHDVYLVLGLAAEFPDNCDTADGRPLTRAHAHARLARMLGADLENSTEQQRRALASRIDRRLGDLVRAAVEQVAGNLPETPKSVVLAGAGEFLARRALFQVPALRPCAIVSLRGLKGEPLSMAACAYAVAVLSQEREG
jgi:probable H4MPT-linked C1 transfer pathway protein